MASQRHAQVGLQMLEAQRARDDSLTFYREAERTDTRVRIRDEVEKGGQARFRIGEYKRGAARRYARVAPPEGCTPPSVNRFVGGRWRVWRNGGPHRRKWKVGGAERKRGAAPLKCGRISPIWPRVLRGRGELRAGRIERPNPGHWGFLVEIANECHVGSRAGGLPLKKSLFGDVNGPWGG
jgi:hypothetical protein